MPKRCNHCPCYDRENGYCFANENYFLGDYVPKDCPLKSIEQHDNEVRREFAEKVKSEFITDTCWCEMTFEQLDNLLKQYEVKE